MWPPSWCGVLRWCVAPGMVGSAALGCGVLCCVALFVVVVCDPLMVGRAVFVSGPPLGGAWCVLLCCVALRCVVFCCVALCGVVVMCGPPHGGACCVGVWPPAWWGVPRWGAVCCVVWRCVLWWCVAPLMVGRGVLCCVALRCVVLCCVVCRDGGVWPSSWWGVVRWGAVCCAGWRCVSLWCMAPVWWGVLRWCVAPLMVVRAALVCGPPYGWACCVGVRCVVLCGVVLCVVLCDPPYGGACCVGVWAPS